MFCTLVEPILVNKIRSDFFYIWRSAGITDKNARASMNKKMKSTKAKCYFVEKKFRERYTKIQLRRYSQCSTKLPLESGTSRAISAVAILLCLSFLVRLVF